MEKNDEIGELEWLTVFWMKAEFACGITGLVFLIFHVVNKFLRDQLITKEMLVLQLLSFSAMWFCVGMWKLRLGQLNRLESKE